MEDISVFDVIGPNMIGPSSSHTAGALKIALMARHLVKGPIQAVTFRLFGSFARTYRGHGTDRALIAGILGFDTEDKRIRDAYELAEQAGLKVTFEVDTQDQDVHPNTVRIQLVDGDGRVHSVEGSSIGGGEVVLKRLDGVAVNISGSGCTLLVKHIDKPGALAYIATCTSQWNINIAALAMHREARGETAYAELTIDSPAPSSMLDALRAHPLVTEVTQIII